MFDKFDKLAILILEEVRNVPRTERLLKRDFSLSMKKTSSEIDALNEIEKLLDSPFFAKNERLAFKIKKYLQILKNDENKNYENYEKIIDLLNEKVMINKEDATKTSEELEEKFSPDIVKKLVNYLSDRSLNINDYLNKRYTFSQLFQDAHLDTSPDFISYMKNKTFDTKPAIGKCEFLFAVLFYTGNLNKRVKGDVKIDSKELEVKETSNSGARLAGQKGFNKGINVSEFFKKSFSGNRLKDFSNIDFSFNSKRLVNNTNAFIILCNENKETLTLEKARELLKEGYKKLFIDEEKFNTAFAFSNFIDPYFVKNSDGNFTIEQEKIDDFNDALLCFALKYYQLTENFDYLSICRKDEFIILNKSSLDKKSIILDNIKVTSQISFGDNAGPQGDKLGIALK